MPHSLLDEASVRDFMSQFETPDAMRPGAMDLVVLLQHRGFMDLTEAAREILHRIYDGTLQTPKELGRLWELFGAARDEEIGAFLAVHDTRLAEFERTIDSRKLRQTVTSLMDAVELRASVGVPFTSMERERLAKLQKLLANVPADLRE